MGDAASKLEPSDGRGGKAADPNHDGSKASQEPSAARLTEELLRQRLDGKAAIEAAFGDDQAALEGIKQIVNELESPTSGMRCDKEASIAEIRRRRKAEERRELGAKRSVDRRAERAATNWIEKQMRNARDLPEPKLPCDGHTVKPSSHAVETTAFELEQNDKAHISEQSNASYQRDHEQISFTLASSLSACNPPGVMGCIPYPAHVNEPETDPIVPPVPKKTQRSDAQPKVEQSGGMASSGTAALPEFYRLLDISADATFEDVKRAFRREALRWHPDKNRNSKESTERFKRITDAFDTLYDPERRSVYDSGQVFMMGKLKKLQGHGWSSLEDHDDATLTPMGIKFKKQAWRSYVLTYGRIDDDPADIVQDDNDPRAPQIKVKVFWRLLGELAYEDREGGRKEWMHKFIATVWKDTPVKWPSGAELQAMSEASRDEWKERRMVFNRRKEKILLHIELHERYLAIPNRIEKERERLSEKNPYWVSGKTRPSTGAELRALFSIG